jgi:hypothetical protein
MGGMADIDPSTKLAIEEAISKAGGEPSLRQKLNERGWEIKSRTVIGQWLRNGVPAKYCPDIEQITKVACERLCPDVKWGLVRDRRGSKNSKAVR